MLHWNTTIFCTCSCFAVILTLLWFLSKLIWWHAKKNWFWMYAYLFLFLRIMSHWCTCVMYLFKSATRASLKARSFSASYLIVNLFCIIIPYAFSSILSELLGDFASLSRWSLLSSLSVNNSAIKFFEKKFETSLSLWSFFTLNSNSLLLWSSQQKYSHKS